MRRESERVIELPKSEWDFYNIPQSEILACWLYEYSRESVSVNWKPTEKYIVRIGGIPTAPRMAFHGLALPVVPQFPKTPWQDLDQKSHVMVVKSLELQEKNRPPAMQIWSLAEWEALEKTHSGNPVSLPSHDFRRLYGNGANYRNPLMEMSAMSEHGLYVIDWDRSREDIEADFRKCLDRVFAKKPKKKPVQRGGFRDELNWLGCLRIMRHYKGNTRQLHPYDSDKLSVAAPVAYFRDMRKRAGFAREIIAK